jgi:PIN domain nuclease of toxin-antitoxin system
VCVSAASIWEIATKRKLGKLDAPDDLRAQLEQGSFVELPMDGGDAWLAGHLDLYRTDPFDRAIIAQALARGLRVVTRDAWFGAYGVDILET